MNFYFILKCTGNSGKLPTTNQTKHDLHVNILLHMLVNCLHSLTCDGLDFRFFVFLLDVDWRKLCLWHHIGLIQKQQTLVYVDVIVIMGWGRRRP